MELAQPVLLLARSHRLATNGRTYHNVGDWVATEAVGPLHATLLKLLAIKLGMRCGPGKFANNQNPFDFIDGVADVAIVEFFNQGKYDHTSIYVAADAPAMILNLAETHLRSMI